MKNFYWDDDMSKAPRNGDSILVCKKGMHTPWMVYWYEGKRKQGWRSVYGMIMFEPEFWMQIDCPE